MARNVSKNVTPKSSSTRKSNGKGLFSIIDAIFNMDRLLGGVPCLSIALFALAIFLIVLYIASSLHSESLIHQIDKTKAEVEELRADYTTQQADFMKAGKQSEIIKRVESMGIEENKTPPTKIIVKDW
jgi:hypothetical protein